MSIYKITPSTTATLTTDSVSNRDDVRKAREAQQETNTELKLLNARIEEAFDTRITEKDI